MSCRTDSFPACCNPDLGCCFRGAGLAYGHECGILWRTDFKDGLCPFRKLSPEGPNEYDLARASPPVDAVEDPGYTDKNDIWRLPNDD